jgi:hypothetical protein
MKQKTIQVEEVILRKGNLSKSYDYDWFENEEINAGYTKAEADANFLSASTSFYTQDEVNDNFLSGNTFIPTDFYSQSEADANFLSASTSFYTQSEANTNFLSASTSVISNLDDITDVYIDTPSQGDELVFSSSEGKWVNRTSEIMFELSASVATIFTAVTWTGSTIHTDMLYNNFTGEFFSGGSIKLEYLDEFSEPTSVFKLISSLTLSGSNIEITISDELPETFTGEFTTYAFPLQTTINHNFTTMYPRFERMITTTPVGDNGYYFIRPVSVSDIPFLLINVDSNYLKIDRYYKSGFVDLEQDLFLTSNSQGNYYISYYNSNNL